MPASGGRDQPDNYKCARSIIPQSALPESPHARQTVSIRVAKGFDVGADRRVEWARQPEDDEAVYAFQYGRE